MRDQLLRFDINLFSLIILVTMLVITKVKRDVYSYSSTLLHWIISVTIAALIVEPISWIFDGSTAYGMKFVNYTSNLLLIVVAPVLIGLWGSYLDYHIYGDKKRLRKLHFYQVPTYLTLVLLVVNAFYPLVFHVTDVNRYIVGDFFWIRYIFIYSVYVYLMYLLFKSRKHLNSYTIFGIAAFFLLPLIGSIMQLIYVEFFFTWTMLAFCVVVVYIFLETTSGNTDYLTALYSRNALENYVKSLYERDRDFCAMMIDLDRFKEVNDKFGHRSGDEVLIAFGKVLEKMTPKGSFVSRYGGDEFFIVFASSQGELINKYALDIREEMKKDTVISAYPFVSFSYGFVKAHKSVSFDEFFNIADRNMYDDKEKKKLA
ncbi:MAG: GGDEF domain-containing protein [Bacilli bacterium]|nr:GGDEF domain-containing protein [Bacilli bacterium]